MTGVRITEETRGPTTLLWVEGVVDRADAAHLGRLVAEVAERASSGLVVDFSRVRVFPDLALGIFLRGLSRLPVELRGLSQHQQRLSRYLQAAAEAAPPGASAPQRP